MQPLLAQTFATVRPQHALQEADIIDRHRQSLGDAHRACQELGKNANDDYVAMRGPHYTALKEALQPA